MEEVYIKKDRIVSTSEYWSFHERKLYWGQDYLLSLLCCRLFIIFIMLSFIYYLYYVVVYLLSLLCCRLFIIFIMLSFIYCLYYVIVYLLSLLCCRLWFGHYLDIFQEEVSIFLVAHYYSLVVKLPYIKCIKKFSFFSKINNKNIIMKYRGNEWNLFVI